jgi:hypothetical protein
MALASLTLSYRLEISLVLQVQLRATIVLDSCQNMAKRLRPVCLAKGARSQTRFLALTYARLRLFSLRDRMELAHAISSVAQERAADRLLRCPGLLSRDTLDYSQALHKL